MNIIITGGAGFIGSAVIRHLIKHTKHQILNIDKLTYASNLTALYSIQNCTRYHFAKADITNKETIGKLFKQFKPDIILHLAAETHVDRSIYNPNTFIQTNIIGTYQLLENSLHYWEKLEKYRQDKFRFIHISTDEVYGELKENESVFTKQTIYAPNSPYSASKASADHLVRSWNKTYGLPTLITHSTNNYGPFQYPEKLIPKTILNALNGQSIPVYGSGKQIRDWLYVDDHVDALMLIMNQGKPGKVYNIGGNNEQTNIEVIIKICKYLDILTSKKLKNIKYYKDLIEYIQDRPGHDFRYAIDNSQMQKEFGWIPKQSFDEGLKKTITWYLHQRFY
jgi:dTDP-glucose 4,6-dehydratase